MKAPGASAPGLPNTSLEIHMAKKEHTSDVSKAVLQEAADDLVPAHDDGLVEVEKEGETLRVHPSCVKAHQAVGWKVKG